MTRDDTAPAGVVERLVVAPGGGWIARVPDIGSWLRAVRPTPITAAPAIAISAGSQAGRRCMPTTVGGHRSETGAGPGLVKSDSELLDGLLAGHHRRVLREHCEDEQGPAEQAGDETDDVPEVGDVPLQQGQ